MARLSHKNIVSARTLKPLTIRRIDFRAPFSSLHKTHFYCLPIHSIFLFRTFLKMDLSNASLSDLHTIVKYEIYRHIPGTAQKILDRFVQIQQPGDEIGTIPFWKHLGIEVDDEEPVEPKRPRVESHTSAGQDLEFYCVKKLEEKIAPRFKTTQTTYSLELKNIGKTTDLDGVIHRAFNDLIEKSFADGNVNDKVSMTIRHPHISKAIHVPFTEREKLTSEKVISTIERFMRSSEVVAIDETFHIEAVRVNLTNRH